MSTYTLHLIGGKDDEVAILTTTEEDDPCRIQIKYRDDIIEEEASDYFEALCRVRQKLAKEYLIPFCYGASLNVFPSGMARDMGAGIKAYKLTMGKNAKMSDLVGIFDEGPDVIPATVENQRAYFEDWLKTPRN